ncbi:related to U1 small nuclear ribonucleoprotein C [Nakaseomyces glabratus]|nr:related to U1 small nuclear ribonucleoprotein C [Nakaseomyces glabratus]SLM16477.1 related to U1 small nuclear ribonucleoprotein C [Nakaseomyces glabratus]
MARYYCEYCHSYLTHDTLSVRKFHLMGKNHLRVRADYYRSQAIKEQELDRRRCLHGKRPKVYKTKKSEQGSINHNEKLSIKLLSRKEKKKKLRADRVYKKELNNSKINDLSKVYLGSPGYNRVFIDPNRYDIGDTVKASRLPQRYDKQLPHLEVPKMLNIWNTSQKLTNIYYDPSTFPKSSDEIRRMPKTRNATHYKSRQFQAS